MVQNQARDARPDVAVDRLRAYEPLERQPERHRRHRQVDLARVDRRLRPMVVGVALEGRDERALEARVDGREALAQRRPADHVRPELEEGRQPAIVAPAAPTRVRDHGLDPTRRVRGGGAASARARRRRAPFVARRRRRRGPPWPRSSSTPRPSCSRRPARSGRPRWRGSHARRRAGRRPTSTSSRVRCCCSARVIRIPLVFVYQRYLKCKRVRDARAAGQRTKTLAGLE